MAVSPLSDIRVVVSLIVTVLLTVAMVIGGQQILAWKRGAEKAEAQTHTMEATSAIIGSGVKSDADRTTTDTRVVQGRAQYQSSYSEAEANEPVVANRASRPVPDRVRNAFRERRLARERSGCAGEQCGEGP